MVIAKTVPQYYPKSTYVNGRMKWIASGNMKDYLCLNCRVKEITEEGLNASRVLKYALETFRFGEK